MIASKDPHRQIHNPNDIYDFEHTINYCIRNTQSSYPNFKKKKNYLQLIGHC